MIFNPLNAAIDVAIIGPNIQARGICKKSATIALGTEIKITNRNFFEIWMYLSQIHKSIKSCILNYRYDLVVNIYILFFFNFS